MSSRNIPQRYQPTKHKLKLLQSPPQRGTQGFWRCLDLRKIYPTPDQYSDCCCDNTALTSKPLLHLHSST